MIGKSLNARHGRALLAPARAREALAAVLGSQARAIVEVRAQGAEMVACVVVRADESAVRLLRSLELDLREGASAVFGLGGADAAKLFEHLPATHRDWLAVPCTERETKVVLVADGGTGLLSLETHDGKVTIAPMEVTA